MLNNPIVSIIIPVYNSEQYLKECVDSVLAQTYSELDVILVNDGSSDKSGYLCDEYVKKDHRVRAFHKRNGGATSARHFGVNKAIGDWIVFSDSDDRMPDNSIETLVRHLTKEVDIVAGTILYESSNLLISTKTDKQIITPSEYIKLIFDKTTYYGPCSKLIRKSIIERISWLDDTEVFQNEDLLMLVQLASESTNNIAICNDGINYVRISRANSQSTRRMSYNGWCKLFDVLMNTLSSKNLLSPVVENAFVNYAIWNLWYLCIEQGLYVSKNGTLDKILQMVTDNVDVETKTKAKQLERAFDRLYFVLMRRIKNLVKGKSL